jgi:2-haloacid dehalogenase
VIKKPQTRKDLRSVHALAIDIFGTVVDWRGSIIREGRQLKPSIDWPQFADKWLNGYRSRVEEVRTGHRSWAILDVLLLEAFNHLVKEFDLSGTDPKKLARFELVWHRLRPWPDCLPGLKRLRKRFTLGTLSNGNMILLTDMERNAHLPWDSVLSAELVKKYKPEPEPYLLAVQALGPRPEQVMYVAAHDWDLSAGAEKAQMKTAFIPRPREMPGASSLPMINRSYDINASDFNDLADKLGV